MTLREYWQLVSGVSLFFTIKYFNVARRFQKTIQTIEASKPLTLPPPRVPEIPPDYCLNSNDTSGILNQLFPTPKVVEKVVQKIVRLPTKEVVVYKPVVVELAPPAWRLWLYVLAWAFGILCGLSILSMFLAPRRKAERAQTHAADTSPKEISDAEWATIIHSKDEEIRDQKKRGTSYLWSLLMVSVQYRTQNKRNESLRTKLVAAESLMNDYRTQIEDQSNEYQQLRALKQEQIRQHGIVVRDLKQSHRAQVSEKAKAHENALKQKDSDHKDALHLQEVEHKAVQDKALQEQKTALEKGFENQVSSLRELLSSTESQLSSADLQIGLLEAEQEGVEEQRQDLQNSIAEASADAKDARESAQKAQQALQQSRAESKKVQDELQTTIEILQTRNERLRKQVQGFINAGPSSLQPVDINALIPQATRDFFKEPIAFGTGSKPIPRTFQPAPVKAPEPPKATTPLTPALPRPKPHTDVSEKQHSINDDQKVVVSLPPPAPIAQSEPAAVGTSNAGLKNTLTTSRWAKAPPTAPRALIEQQSRPTPSSSTESTNHNQNVRSLVPGAGSNTAIKAEIKSNEVSQGNTPKHTPTKTTDTHVVKGSQPSRGQRLSAWNTFSTRVQEQEAQETAKIATEQKERRDEAERTGKPMVANYVFEETYKKVELGSNVDRSITNVTRSANDKLPAGPGSDIKSSEAASTVSTQSEAPPNETLHAFHIPLALPKHDECGIPMPKLAYDVSMVPETWEPRRKEANGRIKQWNRSELQEYNRQRKSRDRKKGAGRLMILAWVEKPNSEPKENHLFYQEWSWNTTFDSSAAVKPIPIKQTPFNEYIRTKFPAPSGQVRPNFSKTRRITFVVGGNPLLLRSPAPAGSAHAVEASSSTTTPSKPVRT